MIVSQPREPNLTTNKPVIDGVRDEIVRLMNLQKQTLLELAKSPHLFGKDAATMDATKAKHFCEVLENEITKAENLEMVVAVVGTVNAGKSTTINAIVGTEVLPNRSDPMTTLPTAIRHISGMIEPRLLFVKNTPFNELISQLLGNFKPQMQTLRSQEQGTGIDTVPINVLDLIDILLSGELKDIKTEYQGREAIFSLLRCLNDLVRLADMVKVPGSPLDQYTQIQDFPLIEVEFSHLKSVEGYGKGQFTLLDTPGPNEATRGDALRKVLKNQLSKASAVLAVIDYTQRGNEADKELRDFLGVEVDGKGDHFFIAVNKFDQRGFNDSSDIIKLREQISRQFFHGKIKSEQVYPVSSHHAYLANAALRQINQTGSLQGDEAWLEEFCKFAFGLCKPDSWSSAEVACKPANSLLDKSLFNELISTVIQDGYRRAAFTAMHSAINLVVDQNKTLSDFFNFRTTALDQETAALKNLVDELNEDIVAVSAATKELHKQAKHTQTELAKKVNRIQEETKNDIIKGLDDFFRSGKKSTQTSNQKADGDVKSVKSKSKKSSSSPQGSGGAIGGFFFLSTANNKSPQKTEGELFDPNELKIVFDEEKEAIDFSKEVQNEITKILKNWMPKIKDEFDDLLATLVNGMQNSVMENCLKPIASKAEAGVSGKLGFVLKIDLSNTPALILDSSNFKKITGEMMKKETKSENRRRLVEQSGAVGWLKRTVDFFDNDWGWEGESYTFEFDQYVVDLKVVQKRVLKNTNEILASFLKEMNACVYDFVMPEIIKALEKLSVDLEGYRGNLLQSIQDKSKSHEEQERIKKELGRLKKTQTKVQSDTQTTRSELKEVDRQSIPA